MKGQESANLKAVAQMILDQRSDIEQFFLESLEQVKEEKRRKLQEEAAQNQTHQQPEFLPLIEPGSKFSNKNFESQQQTSQQQQKINVELSDLDWADRETVLRLLFSKMNTGETATGWRDTASSRHQSRTTGLSNGGKSNGLNQAFRGDGTGEDGDYYDDDD